jgi:ketosteroid isomerase-like protein
MDTNNLMDELARRGEAGDADGLAALCSPDLVFTQNTGLTGGIEALTALVEGLNELGISVAYSNIRRLTAGDVVVEQRLVTLNRRDGVSASTDMCLVCRINDDGLIRHVDEYLDSAALATVLS